MMSNIYISEGVQRINELYGNLLFDYDQTVKERLNQLAQVLWQAFQNKNEIACIEINNYHPDYLGQKPTVLFGLGLGFEDIQKAIACEYGFSSWLEVEQLGEKSLSLEFEQAVDHLLNGDLAALKSLLHNHPNLIHQTSSFGHGATLLHYVGSNGVEIYRQKVPLNLAQLTQFLLASGADKKALMKVYGGFFTSLDLLLTSAHPYEAGLIGEVEMLLRE